MAKLQGRSQVIALLNDNEILEGVNIHFNKELGRGSYAAVYQAEWRGLSCVAKVFHAVIFPNSPADTWKQLAREIELLQNIRHPNIVQLLGFIPETNSRIPSIIMEQLNTNLTSLIKDHHSLLSFDIQVCILHDVAVGLNFLHGHKEPIVHRDLSSNNILITDHLVAKISDLGLAKHIKSAEQQVGSYTGFGTQDYMPPEVLGQRPPQISPKTDVFSFGVVMLQMAVGRSPDVKGMLNIDTEADRRKYHLDLLSESNNFYPLILQCLCNKSYDRPTTVVLCEALKKFGVDRKSTLKLTEAFQEEKVGLIKQLEALQLQKDSSIEVERLNEKITKQKSTIQDLQMQLTSMEQGIAGLEEQNNSFQEKVVTLQSMKDELQECINATEQEKAVLSEQLRLLQQSNSKVSSLRAQLNQITMERDEIQKQMASIEHSKTLLEGENISQKATIAALKAQISVEKESAEGNVGSLETTSFDEAIKKAMEESAAKDATITDLHTRMLELKQTRVQLENEVDEMRDQKEKMLVENAQLREVATQPTKYQHAVEKIKQLKQDNQELGNALERAQAELQLFKENSMALKEQLDKATDQARLDAITDKMSKYKIERDDSRAQVQGLQEQLHTQGSVGGAISVISGDNLVVAPSDDNTTTCPLCHVIVASANELQLHYLQSCAGYDNDVVHDPMQTRPVGYQPLATQQDFGSGYDRSTDRLTPSSKETITNHRRLEQQLTNINNTNEGDNMMVAPSDDDVTTCPLCHVTVTNANELQLHYLQSCPGYDNDVAHDPMQTKPVVYQPLATQQDFGGGYDRSSDRLILSSKETTTDRSRAAVGSGDGNFSTLSQRLVKFVWFPNDPFKVHESKVTLLFSLTAGEGSVELFKDKNDDIGSYSSSTVSVRIGKFDDGQIVIGEEMLQVEPYEVSNDSDEIYLITKEKDTPGPPPVRRSKWRDVVTKVPHYREKQNEAIVQVQTYNRQISEDQPSSLPSSHDVFGSEYEQHLSTSDVPLVQSSLQSFINRSGKIKATSHLATPASNDKTPSKISPQSVKMLPTSSGIPGALKQPSSKSVIKEVVTARGNQTVSCEPVSAIVEIKKGQRVVVSRANSCEYGTVRAVNVLIGGKIKGFIGIEMDLPSGSTDGQVKGVRHFKCQPKHAVFVRLKYIFKIEE